MVQSLFAQKIFYQGEYKAVSIGKQIWMVDNLNVETFRNGDFIPQAKTKEEWAKARDNKQPAWCYYNNDSKNGIKYGKLYNGYAVIDPRGLAPKGWRIPSQNEFIYLHTEVVGQNFEVSKGGKKIKSTSGWSNYEFFTKSTTFEKCPDCYYWNQEYRSKVPCHTCKDTRKVTVVPPPPVTVSGNGTNESGFSAQPGGFRSSIHGFVYLGEQCNFWTSEDLGLVVDDIFGNKLDTIKCVKYYNDEGEYSLLYPFFNGGKGAGVSVRCIKE
jgi:uncharacterized protein (TIGR02145 family)